MQVERHSERSLSADSCHRIHHPSVTFIHLPADRRIDGAAEEEPKIKLLQHRNQKTPRTGSEEEAGAANS